MIVVNKDPDLFVISGRFENTAVITNPSIGAPYEHINRMMRDHVDSITTPSYEFRLDDQWLDRIPVITTVNETPAAAVKQVGDERGSRIYNLDLAPVGGITETEFLSFKSGTIAETVANLMLSKLNTGSPVIDMWNHPTNPTQWNRNCWGFGFDMTGIVMRSSFAGGWTKERGGILTTLQHIRVAAHYPIGLGWKVRFLTKGATPEQDVIVERTLVGQFDARNLYSDDMIIYTLDSPVPAGISPVMVTGLLSYQEPNGSIMSPGMFPGKFSDLVVSTGSDPSAWDGMAIGDGRLSRWSFVDGVLQGTYPPETRSQVESWIEDWLQPWVSYRHMIRPVLKGDSGSPRLFPISSTTIVDAARLPESTHNDCINRADLDAVARGALQSVTGLTVTVAPDL